MKKNKAFSIKKRLTSSLIILSALFLLISFHFSYQASHHEINEVYDARLGQTAKIFLLNSPSPNAYQSEHEFNSQFEHWLKAIDRLAHNESQATRYGHPYENNMVIQVYQGTSLRWSSQPEIKTVAVDPHYSGFGWVNLQGQRWRYFQLPLLSQSEGKGLANKHVLVAEKESIRQEMMRDLAMSFMIPQLILILCLAVIMYTLINYNFRPMDKLSSAITQRNINKLDKIVVERPTIEFLPLVNALNQLLDKLNEAWQREKRFTRTAAHELKTPLAVLRINAENALRSTSPAELEQDLHHILLGIERSDRLIAQLLTFARVESVREISFHPINIQQLLQETIAGLVPLALKKNQEFSLESDIFYVHGDKALLSILLTNILDNAMRYSGYDSYIAVSVEKTATKVNIYIADSGADLTPEAREKLFETFYRSHPERGDGAGLGLAITQDIALLHDGKVSLLPRHAEMNTFLIELPEFQRLN